MCIFSPILQSDPEVALAWEDIAPISGSRVVDNVWDENRTCTFSGCYETYAFSTHWIHSSNCTIPGTVANLIYRNIIQGYIMQTQISDWPCIAVSFPASLSTVPGLILVSCNSLIHMQSLN